MVPVASSILVDAFPPEKRGQAFALFGVAVAVAPVVGPTLGGWLSDNVSWHWCFLINGPVGVMTLALITFVVRDSEAAVEEQRKWRQQKDGFDVVGFVLVATFLGTLEIVLDRGLEDDWFGSSFITTVAILCALAFVLMIPWEMNSPQSDDRHPDGGDASVRRVFSGDAGDRRPPARHDPVPSRAGAGRFRLHRDLGRRHGLAGRRCRHGDDVRRRPPGGQDPAEIPDRRRSRGHRAVDVPIRGPLRDAPLAVCDATTVAFTDFVPADLVYRDRTGETYRVNTTPLIAGSMCRKCGRTRRS